MRKLTGTLLYIIVLTSIITFSTLQIAEAQSSNFLTYKNSIYGYSIQYPSDWLTAEYTEPIFQSYFESPEQSIYGDASASISVGIVEMEPNSTFEEYLNSLDLYVTEFYENVKISETTLAGQPAYKIVYDDPFAGGMYGDTGTDFKVSFITTNLDQRAYGITFTFQPEKLTKYESTAQKMIDSFEFLAPPASVSGTYVNPDVGLEIEFPQGWQGIEIKDEVTIAFVTPGITIQPFSQSPQMSDMLEFSMIMIVIGDFADVQSVIINCSINYINSSVN